MTRQVFVCQADVVAGAIPVSTTSCAQGVFGHGLDVFL